MQFISYIYKCFVYALMMLTMIFTPPASSTETAELISTDIYAMDEAMVMGQGITTDGEYFYTSGTITSINFAAIAKYTVDGMELVDRNLSPIPEVCEARGNNHIGGITYYNSKIYASVEGGSEVPACIVVYDAETLNETGEIYDLPKKDFYDGVPWCAIDGETGYLYASMWDETNTIYVFDVNDEMKSVKTIQLTGLGSVSRIQGGEFYNGTLYLSQDTKNNGSVRNILSVNVETGEVAVAAQRDIGSEDYEAEGMTFTEGENGPVLYVLDYNKTIAIFIHQYNVDF